MFEEGYDAHTLSEAKGQSKGKGKCGAARSSLKGGKRGKDCQGGIDGLTRKGGNVGKKGGTGTEVEERRSFYFEEEEDEDWHWPDHEREENEAWCGQHHDGFADRNSHKDNFFAAAYSGCICCVCYMIQSRYVTGYEVSKNTRYTALDFASWGHTEGIDTGAVQHYLRHVMFVPEMSAQDFWSSRRKANCP